MRALTILLLVQMTCGLAGARAGPVSAEIAGPQVKRMIALAAAMSTEVPSTWSPDQSLEYDYAGVDGFVLLDLVPMQPSGGVNNIAEACDIVSNHPAFSAGHITTPFVWRSQSTCLIESLAGIEPRSVATVVRNDQAQTPDMFVVILADGAHFEGILQSVAFGLESIELPEILNAAIDEISRVSLFRDQVDWPVLRNETRALLDREMAADVDEPLMIPILWVLNRLKQLGADSHNAIIPRGRSTGSADSMDQDIRVDVMNGEIVYLNVPGNSEYWDSLDMYAAQLQDAVAESPQPACGWVIDLRNNEGGNLYAMLSGLAGILSGTTVEFMDANGAITRAMAYPDGSTQIETPLFGTLIRQYGTPQAPLIRGDDLPPIAILIGPRTASAGEALAIALINRGNVRLFGGSTSGNTSAPIAIPLSDALSVSISAAWFLDEDRNTVSAGITPDEFIADGEGRSDTGLPDSSVAVRAMEWLASTSASPSCGRT